MDIHPEHLVECWHVVTGGGDEPLEWQMDQAMWDAVEDAARKREPIDAGDHFADVGDLTLLGTPVEISDRVVPVLKYRSQVDGEIYVAPVIGNMEEASAAIRRSHGRGTDAPR